MPSSFGFKKGFLNKKSSTSSSSSTTTTAATVPSDITTEASASSPSSRASGFREPLPGRDECPICCHVLPLASDESVYRPCCGKIICHGCIVGRQRAILESTGYIIDGITPEEEQFRLILEHWSNLCPFCRSEDPDDEEEYVERLLNRINIRNDEDYANALNTLGTFYHDGKGGLPQSIQKAEELFQQSYDLDYPTAAFHLFYLYKSHHPDQKEKMMGYARRGETLGNIRCTQELGDLAYESGNFEEYKRLNMKGARSGNDNARDNLMAIYKGSKGLLLSKDDLTITLRAHQASNDEMKTVQRGFARRFRIFRFSRPDGEGHT